MMMFTQRIIGVAAAVMLTFAGFASAQQNQQGAQAELHNGQIYVLDQQTLSILDAETLDVQQSVDLQEAVQRGPQEVEGEESPWYRNWFGNGNGEEPRNGEQPPHGAEPQNGVQNDVETQPQNGAQNDVQPQNGAMTNGAPATIQGESILAVDDSGVFIYNNEAVHRFSLDDLTYEAVGRLQDAQREPRDGVENELEENGLEEDGLEENGLENDVEAEDENGWLDGWRDDEGANGANGANENQYAEPKNGMANGIEVGQVVDMKIHDGDVYVLTSDSIFVLADDLRTVRSAKLDAQINGAERDKEPMDGAERDTEPMDGAEGDEEPLNGEPRNGDDLFNGNDEAINGQPRDDNEYGSNGLFNGEETSDGMTQDDAKLLIGDEGVFVIKGDQIHRFSLGDLQREADAPVDGAPREEREPVEDDDRMENGVEEEENGEGWFN